MEWKRDGYTISDDSSPIDAGDVYELLRGMYWSAGRPLETIRRSMDNSLCLGLYHNGGLVGFARAVTDRAVFSWICDVVVIKEHQGRGLGKWLLKCISDHPDVKDTEQVLRTMGAKELYEQYGFIVSKDGIDWMRKVPVWMKSAL